MPRINFRTSLRTGPGTSPELDASGKVVLDHIYDQPDPRAYFSALKPHDYAIPKFANAYFTEIERYLSGLRHKDRVGIVDVGCSYGINAALLKLGIGYDTLVDNYAGNAVSDLSRGELIERDRRLIKAAKGKGPVVTGVDISRPALRYALDAGFIDAAVDTNLEVENLTQDDRCCIADKDLVISTGCIGYISSTTICRLVDGIIETSGGARPWSAHFVLRMFSYDQIASNLAERGYETFPLPCLFPQRKFISSHEQRGVVDQLRDMGVDPQGRESEGSLYAQLFLSLPRDDVEGARPLLGQLKALEPA